MAVTFFVLTIYILLWDQKSKDKMYLISIAKKFTSLRNMVQWPTELFGVIVEHNPPQPPIQVDTPILNKFGVFTRDISN